MTLKSTSIMNLGANNSAIVQGSKLEATNETTTIKGANLKADDTLP
jgi:hypothetical protein